MPKLSVWLIRASLLHMGAGFLFGALILQHKGLPLFDWPWQLLTPHRELLIFGWTIQLVMGVAFYALPRFTPPAHRYGAEHWGWIAFFLLNGGVLVMVYAHWIDRDSLYLIGQLLVLIAVVAFVRLIWPRIKPYAVG